MSDIDEESPEYAKFMAMLQMLENRDSSKELNQLQNMAISKATGIKHATSKIYMKKEVSAGCSTFDDSNKDCRNTITKTQMSVNNVAAVQAAVSNIVLQAQLQEKVKQHGFTSSELDPKFKLVVSHSRECEALQAKLAEVLASMARRQQAIMEKRIRLAALHKRVNELWQKKEKRILVVDLEPEPEKLKELRQRVKGRESRNELISHFLQTLIMGTTSTWGKDRELVQVLRACELINTQQMVTLDQCQVIVDLLRWKPS